MRESRLLEIGHASCVAVHLWKPILQLLQRREIREVARTLDAALGVATGGVVVVGRVAVVLRVHRGWRRGAGSRCNGGHLRRGGDWGCDDDAGRSHAARLGCRQLRVGCRGLLRGTCEGGGRRQIRDMIAEKNTRWLCTKSATRTYDDGCCVSHCNDIGLRRAPAAHVTWTVGRVSGEKKKMNNQTAKLDVTQSTARVIRQAQYTHSAPCETAGIWGYAQASRRSRVSFISDYLHGDAMVAEGVAFTCRSNWRPQSVHAAVRWLGICYKRARCQPSRHCPARTSLAP